MDDSVTETVEVLVGINRNVLAFLANVHYQLEELFNALGINPTELNGTVYPTRNDQSDSSMAAREPTSGFRPFGSDE